MRMLVDACRRQRGWDHGKRGGEWRVVEETATLAAHEELPKHVHTSAISSASSHTAHPIATLASDKGSI